MEKFKAIGAGATTIVTGLIVVWWLYIVASRIGVRPVVEKGNVVLDEWTRATQILTVVLPLFSATLAYWLGSQGVTDAKREAEGAQAKLHAVIDSAPEEVLLKAKQNHPGSFPGL